EVERRLRSPHRRRSIVVLLLLSLVVATSGIYYACFTVLLVAAALLYRLMRGSTWRGLALGALPAVAVVIVLALSLAPAAVHARSNPPLAYVADRLPWESVIYSGSLAYALMPAPVSWLPG